MVVSMNNLETFSPNIIIYILVFNYLVHDQILIPLEGISKNCLYFLYFTFRENADDRRAKLREVEVKVMQYQDELESGKRALKGGWNIYQQVEHYRRKLLKKVQKSPVS